jgi:hypothetical protein
MAETSTIVSDEAVAPAAGEPNGGPAFNEEALKVKEFNSPHRIMENVMTLGQLVSTRKTELRSGRAVLFIRSDTYNPKSPLIFLSGKINPGAPDNPLANTGNCLEITRAGINRGTEIIDARSYLSPVWMVGILHEPSLAGEPKQRNYNVESVLGNTILELCRLAPKNPTLRAHLTSIYRTPPPAAADTYEKLRDWMEFEFDQPFLEGNRKAQYGIVEAPPKKSAVSAAAGPAKAFDIPVAIVATVTGTARFRAKATKQQHTTIIKDTMSRSIRDGYTVNQLVDLVSDHVAGDMVELETAEITDHEYVDRVVEETENIERKVEDGLIQRLVIAYIQRQYGTQEAQEIIARQ